MAISLQELEESVDMLSLPLSGEEDLPRVPLCSGCGAPIFDDEILAYDAWDRSSHMECMASIPHMARR